MPSEFVLSGGVVLAENSSVPIRADITVSGGRIVSVAAPGLEAQAGAERLDVSGCLVIPGLVNAHYHSHDVLARGMFEDIPLEVWIALAILPPGQVPTAREVRLRTLIGAVENLMNGTTTVQDMLGCGPDSGETIEAALAAYDEVGIRCVMSLQVGDRPAIDCLPGIRRRMPAALHPLIDGSPPPPGVFLDFVEDALKSPRRPRLHWAVAPGSPQRCSLPLLAGLGDLARRYDTSLVTHVNESRLQVFLAEELYGGSVLDYLSTAGVLDRRLVMAHGIWFSEAEIARIAEAGSAVATNPASNLKLKNGVAPHRALVAMGVRLALGCDNVSAGDAQNMFEAMRSLALLNAGKGPGEVGLDSRTVFRTATEGGAEVLGLGEEIGAISTGRRADLVVLDLAAPAYLPLNDAVRQIVYAESGRAVRHVIVDGRLVVHDRKPVFVDMAALTAEMADLAASVQRDYRAHFERMAPVVAHIGALVREIGTRPLSFDRWASADDAQDVVCLGAGTGS